MDISEDNYLRLLQALALKGYNNTCKECNHKPMIIFKQELQLVSYERVGSSLNSSKINWQPVLSVICPNCGSIKLFSIKVLLPDYE